MKLFMAITLATALTTSVFTQSQSIPLNIYGSPERSRVLTTEPVTESPQTTVWKTTKLFVLREVTMTEGFSGPFRFAVDLPTSQWFSFPIVSGAIILFVFQATDNGYLYALDATTGKQVLVLKFPELRLSPPAVRGSQVFFGDNKGLVHAVDIATRSEIWSLEQKNRPANIAAPIIDNELLYIYFGGLGLHAIDLETGNVRWMFKSPDNAEGLAVSNDRIVIVTIRGTLICVDKKTGAKQWEAKVDSDASSPLIMGDQVFLRFRPGDIRAYSVADGSLRWKGKPSGGTGSLLAATKQLVLFSGREHSIVAIDAATGVEKWKFKTNNQCDHPLVVGDLLYAACGDKKFYAVDVMSGKEKWRMDNSSTRSMTTIANGIMYLLGADGYLTAMR